MGAVPDQISGPGRRRFPIVALILWAILAFAAPLVVEPLNLITVFGFPLGFLVVAQGALIAFVLIAIVCARRQDKQAGVETAEG